LSGTRFEPDSAHIFNWMPDFALAPLFPLVSCREIFIQIAFSPNFWLVPVGFLVVQSIHIHRFDGGFDLIVGLKFQIAR
jgi:hypothetical protein